MSKGAPRNANGHSYIVGDAGEKAVAEILKAMGYKVSQGQPLDYDLLIEGFLTVEVKTAHLSKRVGRKAKRWQFCLTRNDGTAAPFGEDVLILRCLTSEPCHFVIPGILVPKGLARIDITSPKPFQYQGKWSVFWEAWDVIDMVLCYRLLGGFR